MSELCDDCGLADSKGNPCYMMFRKKTNINTCTRYVSDPKKHAELAKAAGVKVGSADEKKPAAGEQGGGEG